VIRSPTVRLSAFIALLLAGAIAAGWVAMARQSGPAVAVESMPASAFEVASR
jgi:hypothetical protein